MRHPSACSTSRPSSPPGGRTIPIPGSPPAAASAPGRRQPLAALRRDFPVLPRPGYHPVDTFTPRGAFADLLAEIEAGALDRAMSAQFGLDFIALPRLVTVRQVSAAHEGRPHTDSASKVATLLLYMHSGWASPEGRIRVLRRESLADPVAEVSPEAGNIFAFLRGEHSWHGHTPFVGERRVVQVAWLRDAAALERKRRRGLLAWRLKGLFGRH
ncbi:2OG-Fe(II) oxygenase [Roseicella sp. DB1501]|uniref:2OG-Fe(II) oxygenase n=1 Tax=Roseicella sp. DB1501 TaxID=2730925 RepID=UPI001C2BCC9A|nr:2OG-Fe(II) oxygenase [Roseicella sp. DB1501]